MRFRPVALFCFVILVMSGAARADDYADRVKLIGAWESEDSSAMEHWLFEGQDENLHVVHSKGAQKIVDYACKATGSECSTKIDGKPAKVTMYFSGAALVVMETRGSDVMRERFSTTGAGDEMQLEMMPITGKGKAETLHFKRAAEAPKP